MPVIKTPTRLLNHETGNSRRVVIGYIVESPVGTDPLEDIGVPRVGDLLPNTPEYRTATNYNPVRARRMRSYRFIARRLASVTIGGNVAGVTQVDVFEIDVEFSDEWIPQNFTGASLDKVDTYTWAREELSVPFFRRLDRVYFWNLGLNPIKPPLPGTCQHPPGNQAVRFEWVLEPLTIFVPFTIKTRTVWVRRGSITQQDRNNITAQIGRLHKIAETFARFEPPRIVEEDNRRTRIEYAWMYDPGNGPIQPPDSNTCPQYIAPSIPRPPWHRYRVVPGATLNDPPTIETYNTMPELINGQKNDYVEPEGFLVLPGQPLDQGEAL